MRARAQTAGNFRKNDLARGSWPAPYYDPGTIMTKDDPACSKKIAETVERNVCLVFISNPPSQNQHVVIA
jgi:hypothetical protein